MRARLVFHAWLDKNGKPVAYFSEESFGLSAGNFRFGATFQVKIELDEDAADDLRAALAEGYRPVFYAVAIDPDDWRAEADEAESCTS